MGVPLAEALGQVDREVGQVYRCQVKGNWVELRVLDAAELRSSLPEASDVMLDPWAEFSLPAPSITAVGKFRPLPLPDVPLIPSDEAAT